jgi:hypothetical protein
MTKISSFSRMSDADTFIELAAAELDRRGFFPRDAQRDCITEQ